MNTMKRGHMQAWSVHVVHYIVQWNKEKMVECPCQMAWLVGWWRPSVRFRRMTDCNDGLNKQNATWWWHRYFCCKWSLLKTCYEWRACKKWILETYFTHLAILVRILTVETRCAMSGWQGFPPVQVCSQTVVQWNPRTWIIWIDLLNRGRENKPWKQVDIMTVEQTTGILTPYSEVTRNPGRPNTIASGEGSPTPGTIRRT